MALSRAQVLAEQLDRQGSLAPLIISQFWFQIVRVEYRPALALGEQLENLGEVGHDTAVQLLGRSFRGVACFLLGEFIAARTVLERCMGLADPAYCAPGHFFNSYHAMLEYLSLTLACLGYIDQARSRMDEPVSEARRVGRVYPLAHALFQETWMDWLTGSPMIHLEELLTRSSEQGFAFFLGWALALRGWSLIARGQAQEGLALLTQGLTELRPTKSNVDMPALLWATAYAMLGQTAEERNCLVDESGLLEATEGRVFEAELLHRVPHLLNAAGDQAGAERHYRQAIAVAERQSAKLLQLKASVSLAWLWRDQGKRAKARELLGPIYNWFTEGFDTREMKDAKGLLDELA